MEKARRITRSDRKGRIPYYSMIRKSRTQYCQCLLVKFENSSRQDGFTYLCEYMRNLSLVDMMLKGSKSLYNKNVYRL